MKRAHILYYILLLNLFLGIHQGNLALWKEGCAVPEAVYPCPVHALPLEDQSLLKQGIPVASPEELTARLEDLLS